MMMFRDRAIVQVDAVAQATVEDRFEAVVKVEAQAQRDVIHLKVLPAPKKPMTIKIFEVHEDAVEVVAVHRW